MVSAETKIQKEVTGHAGEQAISTLGVFLKLPLLLQKKANIFIFLPWVIT